MPFRLSMSKFISNKIIRGYYRHLSSGALSKLRSWNATETRRRAQSESQQAGGLGFLVGTRCSNARWKVSRFPGACSSRGGGSEAGTSLEPSQVGTLGHESLEQLVGTTSGQVGSNWITTQKPKPSAAREKNETANNFVLSPV